MAYTPIYSATDLGSMGIDLGGVVLYGFLGFGALIALVWIAGWFAKKIGDLHLRV